MSAISSFEILHVRDQRLYAFDGHGVVDRSSHAADRTVPLELHHAVFLGALEERLVLRLVLEPEGNVHTRTILFAHRTAVEPAAIEIIIDKRRLSNIVLLDRRQSALR